MKHKNNKGFTLLEVIIVIIIIAVLASLAIPRFQRTTLFARSQEAIRQLSTIRESMERCAMFNNGSFASCALITLDVEVPGVGTAPASPNFSYAAVTAAGTFTVTATCTATGCVPADTINIIQTGALNGAGIFASI